MEQGTCDDGSKWSEIEREISAVLVEMHRVCLLRRIPITWGCKRRRSAIQDTPSPSSSLTPCAAVVKAQASSPATPLSFSPTESDDKPKPSRSKRSLKREREYYLKIIQDLTESKASLNQEMDNVKRHCDQLKTFNLKLKARQHELSNGPKSESQNPNLEIGRPMQLVHANGSVNSSNSTAENEEEQKPPQQQMQMPNQNYQLGPSQIRNGEGVVQFQCVSGHLTTPLPALGCKVNSNKGPLTIPDLNLSVEEFIHVDSFQPLDETTANKGLSKAMAAQARQRRLQIFRLKKPIGSNSKPRHSYR